MIFRTQLTPFVCAIGLALSSGIAHAQDDVAPPVLVRGADADPGIDVAEETAVVLELSIDAQGRVTDVRVLEGATEELDRAATRVARGLEFTPAKRGDQAIAVKIRYRHVFAPRAVPEPEPVAEPAPTPVPTQPVPETSPTPPANGSEEPEYGATAEVDAPTTSVTRRAYRAEQLSRVPGVRGDAIKAVEVLPGVARSPAFDGSTPIIRGASQFESQVFLDGTPVPLLFHFGGITSFFQSRLLERVEYYPGNFSVRYGRVTGGIVDARVREPARDRFHAMLDLSVLDSAAMVEAPLSDSGAVAVAARRSNVDFFFETFVPEDAYDVVAAPVYWDYQAMTAWRLGSDHRLRLLGYGSRDSIDLVFSEPQDFDPALRGGVGGHLEFHHLNARLDSKLDRDVRHALSLTLGLQDLSVNAGTNRQELRTLDLFGRSELSVAATREVELQVGLDFASTLADGTYVGPRPSAGFEGDPTVDESSQLTETITGRIDDHWVASPALWLELLLRPIERVLIVPGVRVDYFQSIDAWTIDPRLAVRWETTESTTLKGGVGIFSQAPIWWETLEDVGNPDLEPYHAAHFSIGAEQKVVRGVDVELEGFYKRIWNRVVATEGSAPPHHVNDGSGRIWGAELGLSLQPSPRTFGYLAYTLSRSERRERNGDWRLFDGDQTHVVSAAASQKLGAGWELGARFRYTTGSPSTPVVGAVYDARVDQYRPIYGALNSERQPAFHQLDVRVEKGWQISDLSLAVYLEVLNVYNAQNHEFTEYSYDYSEQRSLSGLPIIPNLGVRGEL